MNSPSTGGVRPVVTVIQSSPDVPLDRFAGWLEGVELRVVAAYAGGSVPTVDEVGDGLLVLGGHMSAVDDERAPWLPALRTLLVDASEADVPTLGICLGAQLLAVAHGGRVEVAAPPGREAGVIDVRWRPEADGDPVVGTLALLGDARRSTPAPSMHADAVVDLPRGAVWLAASAMYPYQAFRIGSAWGVQFHPEAGPAVLRGWAEQMDDVDTHTVLAQVAERGDAIDAAGAELARSFGAHVRAAHRASVAA